MTTATMNIDSLTRATAFVWAEADMLDHAEYAAWLDLWAPDGLYVVPIDPEAEHFADTLNYAHDDAAMRLLRVQRLTGGESVSTQPRARTARSVSRLRLLAERDGVLTLRGAQDLHAFRKNGFQHHTANVTWELVRHGESWRIRRKVVRLLNSTDALRSIGYIL